MQVVSNTGEVTATLVSSAEVSASSLMASAKTPPDALKKDAVPTSSREDSKTNSNSKHNSSEAVRRDENLTVTTMTSWMPGDPRSLQQGSDQSSNSKNSTQNPVTPLLTAIPRRKNNRTIQNYGFMIFMCLSAAWHAMGPIRSLVLFRLYDDWHTTEEVVDLSMLLGSRATSQLIDPELGALTIQKCREKIIFEDFDRGIELRINHQAETYCLVSKISLVQYLSSQLAKLVSKGYLQYDVPFTTITSRKIQEYYNLSPISTKVYTNNTVFVPYIDLVALMSDHFTASAAWKFVACSTAKEGDLANIFPGIPLEIFERIYGKENRTVANWFKALDEDEQIGLYRAIREGAFEFTKRTVVLNAKTTASIAAIADNEISVPLNSIQNDGWVTGYSSLLLQALIPSDEYIREQLDALGISISGWYDACSAVGELANMTVSESLFLELHEVFWEDSYPCDIIPMYENNQSYIQTYTTDIEVKDANSLSEAFLPALHHVLHLHNITEWIENFLTIGLVDVVSNDFPYVQWAPGPVGTYLLLDGFTVTPTPELDPALVPLKLRTFTEFVGGSFDIIEGDDAESKILGKYRRSRRAITGGGKYVYAAYSVFGKGGAPEYYVALQSAYSPNNPAYARYDSLPRKISDSVKGKPIMGTRTFSRLSGFLNGLVYVGTLMQLLLLFREVPLLYTYLWLAFQIHHSGGDLDLWWLSVCESTERISADRTVTEKLVVLLPAAVCITKAISPDFVYQDAWDLLSTGLTAIELPVWIALLNIAVVLTADSTLMIRSVQSRITRYALAVLVAALNLFSAQALGVVVAINLPELSAYMHPYFMGTLYAVFITALITPRYSNIRETVPYILSQYGGAGKVLQKIRGEKVLIAPGGHVENNHFHAAVVIFYAMNSVKSANIYLEWSHNEIKLLPDDEAAEAKAQESGVQIGHVFLEINNPENYLI